MNAPAPDVVHFKVGELVSIKVPRSDCHKTDCKRILGIVVNQHGEKDHQCDIPVTFKVFVQQLIESDFRETECQSCLSAISHAGSWEALSSTARYIVERLPDLQTEEPIPIIHAEKLGIYGDGFIQFIPLDIQSSHTVFQMSVDDNNCLFNSISLVLWGHAKKTVFLCLAAAIYGIVNHEKMVDQVMEGIMD